MKKISYLSLAVAISALSFGTASAKTTIGNITASIAVAGGGTGGSSSSTTGAVTNVSLNKNVSLSNANNQSNVAPVTSVTASPGNTVIPTTTSGAAAGTFTFTKGSYNHH